MENRGSKSKALVSENAIVKEQRIDGNWQGVNNHSCLRCILMGFERNCPLGLFSGQTSFRNYQVKILSKQFKSRHYYSTNATSDLSSSTINKSSLDSLFVTGFVDAEGCFTISIRKKFNGSSFTYYSEARFAISLHKNDLMVLEAIKSYFGGKGNIVKHGSDSLQYVITSIKQIITMILPHFDNYPLITKKYADYILFKEAVNLINNKKHLTKEGLTKVISIRASMNLGLSDELKVNFPGILPTLRPLVEDKKTFNPEWVGGFTSGEGSFIIKISKSPNSKLGVGVQLIFQITQHSRDKILINNLVSYFGCGKLVEYGDKVNFIVGKFSDITEKIIPFFNKHPVVGVKLLNYNDWCKVAEIIKAKGHLTKFGLDQIVKIKERINRNRSENYIHSDNETI